METFGGVPTNWRHWRHLPIQCIPLKGRAVTVSCHVNPLSLISRCDMFWWGDLDESWDECVCKMMYHVRCHAWGWGGACLFTRRGNFYPIKKDRVTMARHRLALITFIGRGWSIERDKSSAIIPRWARSSVGGTASMQTQWNQTSIWILIWKGMHELVPFRRSLQLMRNQSRMACFILEMIR